jgi:hypothetical protein
MPDLPQDPRQLARDILAGKVSIEDLAREQARRRAGQAPAPPRPMNRPQSVPPVQPPLAAAPVPPIRTVPPVRRVPLPPQPPRRPVPPQIPRTVGGAPRESAREVRKPTAQATTQRQLARSPEGAARRPAPLAPISALLRDPRSLRRAVVLSEILGPPVSLR